MSKPQQETRSKHIRIEMTTTRPKRPSAQKASSKGLRTASYYPVHLVCPLVLTLDLPWTGRLAGLIPRQCGFAKLFSSETGIGTDARTCQHQQQLRLHSQLGQTVSRKMRKPATAKLIRKSLTVSYPHFNTVGNPLFSFAPVSGG